MKLASIDIGTNTVLMLIGQYEGENPEILSINNFQSIPRIGKDVHHSGLISNDKIDLLISILKDYKKIANESGVIKILASGTNALRTARNAAYIINKVKSETGISINIIAPEDEALFSYFGAISGVAPEANNMVIDIGGGSTEIITGNGKGVIASKSHQLGVVTLVEKYFRSQPPTEEHINSSRDLIRAIVDKKMFNKFPISNAIAIAGTPTTLACIKNNINDFEEEKIHGSFLTISELQELCLQLSNLTPDEILSNYKISVGREDVIFAGTLILIEIMEIFRIEKVMVSTKGLRYGAIQYYRFMNDGKYFGE